MGSEASRKRKRAAPGANSLAPAARCGSVVARSSRDPARVVGESRRSDTRQHPPAMNGCSVCVPSFAATRLPLRSRVRLLSIRFAARPCITNVNPHQRASGAPCVQRPTPPARHFTRIVRGRLRPRTHAPMICSSCTAFYLHVEPSARATGRSVLGRTKVCYLRCVSFAGKRWRVSQALSQRPTTIENTF